MMKNRGEGLDNGEGKDQDKEWGTLRVAAF